MKLRALLPNPKSPAWFAIGAALGGLAAAVLLLFYAVIFGHDPARLNIPGIILIFMLIGQLVATAGYFGRMLLVLFSVLGLGGGLVLYLTSIQRDVGGFEDLVGALAMLMLIGAGLALGVVAELGVWLWRWVEARRMH